MDSKWTILEALLLFGGVTMLATLCAARTAKACSLPPQMFDRRTTAEPLSEAQREIDHEYVEFMNAVAQSYDQRKAFWFMELISAGGTRDTPTSLLGIPLPNGLLFKFVDEIFGLMKKGNATAAEKYLFLYDDADGEFGEYMDDQLPKLFVDYPREVLALWPIFKKHRKRLEMLQGFMTEREKKRASEKYEGLCQSGDNRCVEIRKFFAAR